MGCGEHLAVHRGVYRVNQQCGDSHDARLQSFQQTYVLDDVAGDDAPEGEDAGTGGKPPGQRAPADHLGSVHWGERGHGDCHRVDDCQRPLAALWHHEEADPLPGAQVLA